MKIAFVSTMAESAWGGSEELWTQAAGIALGEKDDVLAIVPRFDPLDRRITALVGRGMRLATWQPHETHPLAGQLAKGPAWGAWTPLRDFAPDVVVASHGGFMDPAGHPELVALLSSWNAPYVVVVQCNTELQLPNDVQRGIHRQYFANAAKVLFVSRRNLETARIQLASDIPNAEVVDNPVNLRDRSAVAWPETGDGPARLACVARLDSYVKGYDVLLQTLARPEWKDRNWQLEIYGQGVNRPYLDELVAWLGLGGKVRFAGQVEDVRGIWERNEILVMASRMEGTPLALFEAMWCGRPAVVTDVGGNADLVEDGRSGFLAEAATANCLQRALERAWTERANWKSMGEAARAHVAGRDPSPPRTLLERIRSAARPAPERTDSAVPTVSVVVPCYNYGDYLGTAVESVLCQTWQDLEILIVDDGSTDHSLQVARELERRHGPAKVRVLAQRNSGQPAISRNNGIALAKGRYILPLDADDLLAPWAVGAMVQALEERPEASIAYSDYVAFDGQRAWFQPVGRFESPEIIHANQLSYASLYRRELWEEVGGYRTNVRGYEDWDFWIACAALGAQAAKVPGATLFYRAKADGLLHQALEHDARLRANIALNNPTMFPPEVLEKARSLPLAGPGGTSVAAAGEDLEAILVEADRALSAGDLEAGSELLERACRMAPSNAELAGLRRKVEQRIAQRSRGLTPAQKRALGAADQAFARGRIDDALAELSRAEAEPPRLEFVNAKAWLLQQAGRASQAQAEYLNATLFWPDDPSTHSNLAGVLLQKGQVERAEAPLKRVLELRPDDPDAMAALARVLLETGREAEATALAERYRVLHPDHLAAASPEPVAAGLATTSSRR